MENKPATTTLSRTATAITFRSGFLCRTSTLYCQDSLRYQKGLHVVNGKQTSNNNTIKDRYCYCCHHIQVCLFLPEQHLILPGLSKLSKRFAGVVNGKQTRNNNTIKDRYCHHLQVWLFVPDQHLIARTL